MEQQRKLDLDGKFPFSCLLFLHIISLFYFSELKNFAWSHPREGESRTTRRSVVCFLTLSIHKRRQLKNRGTKNKYETKKVCFVRARNLIFLSLWLPIRLRHKLIYWWRRKMRKKDFFPPHFGRYRPWRYEEFIYEFWKMSPFPYIHIKKVHKVDFSPGLT